MAKNQIFPIKVEPACLLKWSWSTVFFDSGTSASCHRTKKYTIDPNNFDNFHNLPEKIRDRKLMLEGQWPGNGCEYCRRVEDSGGVSDRQYHLALQGETCQHPPELNIDPLATSVTPTILEVYFKNTCNMACFYCGPHFSSRWEEENKKFNIEFWEAPKNLHYEKMVEDLWKYLKEEDRYLTLLRYNILGGEPFLLKELDQSIEFWEQNPNINLTFSVITNLNIPTERFEKYVDRFEKMILDRKVWKIHITASLDAWGPQQEYTRYGLNLDLWQKNFEILVFKPWVLLSINSAISALTIKQMPQLIEKINYWNSLRSDPIVTPDNVFNEPISHSFNTTGARDDPFIFGPGVFDDDFDKILSLMPDTTSEQQVIKQQMQSISIAIKNSQRDTNKINNLKETLSVLDQRRETNWKMLFPWLDNDFDD